MSTANSQLINPNCLSGFGERLKLIFGNAQNKEIASRLGVSNPAITAYLQGRVPPAEKLIEIAEFTGCNLHWLLTGTGPKYTVDEALNVTGHAKTVVFHCSKGGVGTSTAALLTAVGLANRGYKTLLVDNVYGSCTVSMFYSLLKGFSEAPRSRLAKDSADNPEEAVCFSTPVDGLDLASFNRKHQSILMKEKIKQENIIPREVQAKYSIIVVDAHSYSNPFNSTNQFMSLLLREAKVFIPFEPYNSDAWSIKITLEYVDSAQRYNQGTEFLGLFVNNYDTRSPVSVGLQREMESITGDKVLHSRIHRSLELWDIIPEGLEKFYRTKSKVGREFNGLVTELLERLGYASQIRGRSRKAS